MAAIDGIVGMGIIIIVFWFILMRIKKKFPELGKGMSEYLPFLKDEKTISSEVKEKSEQRWIGRREIL